MNRALVIGGGKDSLLLLETVRRFPLETVVADRNPAAPGALAATRHLPVGTEDPAPVLAAVREIPGTVVAVLTRASGQAAITAAKVAAALKLPGAGEAAERVIRKDRLAGFCRSARIPHPGIVDPGSGTPEPPLVVKPAFGRVGKAGVALVRTRRELPAALAAARAASSDGRAVVERFLPGRDISLLGYVLGGLYTPWRFLEEVNRFDTGGGLVHERFQVDPALESGAQDRLVRLAEQVALAGKIDSSPMLVSFRLQDDGGAAVVELNLDFGGEGVLERTRDANGSPFIRDYLAGLQDRTPAWRKAG